MISYISCYSLLDLFWHEGSSNLFEAPFTAQWIPKWIEANLAIGYTCWEFRESLQLLDGFVVFTDPRTDRSIKIKDFHAVERVFGGGKELNSPAPLTQRFFFPAKKSINQTQKT